jgi:hypothetical protein
VVSYLLMGVGWLLFAVTTLRTKVFARWAVVLLIVGAVITVVPMPSRTLVLAVAAACLAFAAHRDVLRTAGAGRVERTMQAHE